MEDCPNLEVSEGKEHRNCWDECQEKQQGEGHFVGNLTCLGEEPGTYPTSSEL